MSATTAAAITYRVPKRRHPVLLFMMQQPLGAGGLVVIFLMAVCAVFAPWVAPYDPLTVDYGAMLAAPSWSHWLGTDSFGRDVGSRIIYGARTARAKGVVERLVVARHALRNALLPVVTVIGLEFAFLIGGLVVTEQVFNLNGIGKLFVQAVARSDFTMIQGLVLLVSVFFVLVNFVIDLLYAFLDPRIRYR